MSDESPCGRGDRAPATGNPEDTAPPQPRPGGHTLPGITAFVDVGAAAEVGEGKMKGVEVGEERVLVARVRGELCAIGGICTHQIAYLEDGLLDQEVVYCPRHGAGFDLHSGQALHLPAEMPVPVYDVKETGGRILVSCRPRRLS